MATAAASPKGGVFWSTVNGGASVLLPFAVFAGFARMMTPSELSLVLLAVAMLQLLEAFGPQGIYDVLLLYREDQQRYYRTAGTLFLGGGVILAFVYMAGIAFSAWILGKQLPLVLLVLALKVVFDYALFQPQAVLVKRGAVRRLGMRGLAAGLGAGASGLLVAMVTTPIVGLTAYYLLQSAVAFLMTAFGTGSLIRPGWDGQAAAEMAQQGARASGVRLSAAVSNYLDQLLVGSMMAGALVGAYNLGKRLEVVSMTIGSSFSQFLFQPTFVNAEPGQRVAHIGRGMAAITLVCGVPSVLLAVFHNEAVPLVFGSQWAGAALTAALLTGSGYVRAIGGVAGALYTVTGRNGRLLALSAFGAATNMLMIVIFARFGVLWAAGAVLVRNSVQTVFMVF
ncbi:MAG: oligosaccharide flippase family protein, partial [Novosphingobium sp.]